MTTLFIISLIFDALLVGVIYWQHRKIKLLQFCHRQSVAVLKSSAEQATTNYKAYREMYYVAWGMWWCAVILLIDSAWSWWKARRKA